MIKAAKDKEQEAVEQREAYAERVDRAITRRTANKIINGKIDSCITIWQL
jgi:hypothetical protein